MRREAKSVYLMKNDSKIINVYQILKVFEFDSDRKMMTVVVRTPDDRILVFTKGAD